MRNPSFGRFLSRFLQRRSTGYRGLGRVGLCPKLQSVDIGISHVLLDDGDVLGNHLRQSVRTVSYLRRQIVSRGIIGRLGIAEAELQHGASYLDCGVSSAVMGFVGVVPSGV